MLLLWFSSDVPDPYPQHSGAFCSTLLQQCNSSDPAFAKAPVSFPVPRITCDFKGTGLLLSFYCYSQAQAMVRL